MNRVLHRSSFLVATLCAVVVSASTVAYWPLAYENGVRTTTETVFANQGAGGTLDAVPISIGSNGSVATILEGNSDYCPQGTNAFPVGYGVYDPVSGTRTPTPTGLYFHKISLSNNSGALRVADPVALRLTTFTVECFVRTTWPGGDWHCIAVMPGRLKNGDTTIKNCDSWGLRMTDPANGGLTLRFTQSGYALNGDRISGTNKELYFKCPGIQDGKWHHIAFSINDATHKCAFYYDYVRLSESTLSESVWYNAGEDLYIGNTPQTPGMFGGSIAHFRISDAVLTEESFLRFDRTTAAEDEDPDTLLHLDCEPVEGITERWPFFNDAATGSTLRRAVYVDVPALDAISPVPTAYGSLLDATGRASSHCVTNVQAGGGKRYLSWYPDEDLFTNTSFTVECFYKSSGTQSAWKPLVRRKGGSNVQFNLGFSGGGNEGKLTTAVIQSDGATKSIVDPVRSDDGEWHHAALVVDRARKSVTLFKDYQTVSSVQYNQTIIPTTIPVTIGGDDNQYAFVGAIDNVRITKRALTVGEFIHGEHAVPAGKTVAWASFDNTLESSVPCALTGGVATAAASGGRAPWFKAFPGGANRRIIDGTNAVLRTGDLATLACQTGVVKYASNPVLPLLKDMTVEFRVKAGVQTPATDLVRCNLYQNQGTDPVWRLAFDANNGSKLVLRCTTKAVDPTSTEAINTYGINYNTGIDVTDGKWHHLALTISHSGSGAEAAVTTSVYKDYEATPSWTKTVSGKQLCYGAGLADIWIGASSSTTAFFNGEIDELRISRGILTPDEFLRLGSGATMLIIR